MISNTKKPQWISNGSFKPWEVTYHVTVACCIYRDSNRSLDIFDEKKHPLSVSWGGWLHQAVIFAILVDRWWWPSAQQREKVPDDYSVVDPEHKLIYRFIRTLFSSAQLTAECAIVTLVSSNIHHTAESVEWCKEVLRTITLSACVNGWVPFALGVSGKAVNVCWDGHLSL